jgi:hypothetical protein
MSDVLDITYHPRPPASHVQKTKTSITCSSFAPVLRRSGPSSTETLAPAAYDILLIFGSHMITPTWKLQSTLSSLGLSGKEGMLLPSMELRRIFPLPSGVVLKMLDSGLFAVLLLPIPLLLIFGVITTTLPELLPFLFFFSPSL